MSGDAGPGTLLAVFGTRAGWIIDLFLIVLVAIVPMLLWGVAQVRRGRVRLHATVMTGCFIAFIVAVLAFEIYVRTADVPLPETLPFVIHLIFAVPATVLWIWQVATAKRALQEPARHRKVGRALVVLLILTVGTGVWIYFLTFV